MDPATPRLRGGEAAADALACAIGVVGGLESLARRLGVPSDDLTRWVSGEERPPVPVFLRALDIIAAGPYADQCDLPRRKKVAVLPAGDS